VTSEEPGTGGEDWDEPPPPNIIQVEDYAHGLDRQNAATLGRILGRGRIGYAEEGPDGRMRATIWIPPDELVFDPGVLILPHGGRA
jgi:PQQ system protein